MHTVQTVRIHFWVLNCVTILTVVICVTNDTVPICVRNHTVPICLRSHTVPICLSSHTLHIHFCVHIAVHTVRSHIGVHTVRSHIGVHTVRNHIGLLSCVRSHTVTSPTCRHFMCLFNSRHFHLRHIHWFVCTVSMLIPLVPHTWTFLGKSSGTYITHKRFLSCVNSLMHLPVLLICQYLLTNVTSLPSIVISP